MIKMYNIVCYLTVVIAIASAINLSVRNDGKCGPLNPLSDGSSSKCYPDVCVKLEADGTPNVFWENKWRPLCGHWFWDNNNGAKSFCQRLGYSDGVLEKTHSAYTEDAIRLGRCNSNEDFLSCSIGCNDKGIGDGCAGCSAGNIVGIKMSCSGMVAGTESNSCDAEYELVSEKTSIDGCNGRTLVGDWGKGDPDLKLQRCANEVRDDSRCGPSFFFRESKGKCFCEKQGAQCPRDRKNWSQKNEYVLKNEFRKEVGQYCPFCNSTYGTLEEARNTCKPNLECTVIYDLFCDGVGYFCSCPISSVKIQTHQNGIDCIYKRIV